MIATFSFSTKLNYDGKHTVFFTLLKPTSAFTKFLWMHDFYNKCMNIEFVFGTLTICQR